MGNKMKWSLGHVYDLTDYFDKMVKEQKIIGVGDNCYKYGYFVCHDVWDTHIYRIQVGLNSEYEKEPRTKIIEQEDIRHYKLLEYVIEEYDVPENLCDDIDERSYIDMLVAYMGIENLLKAILDCDYYNGFENYDVKEYRYDTPVETLIRDIDGGYGISKIDVNN